jgi:hypothetical protein
MLLVIAFTIWEAIKIFTPICLEFKTAFTNVLHFLSLNATLLASQSSEKIFAVDKGRG